MRQVRAGIVRGNTEAEVERIGADLDELVARVHELLPGTRDVPAEIWIVAAIGDPLPIPVTLGGITQRSGNWIGIDRDHDPAEEKAVLAHELVHLLMDVSWDALPQVVEEGLCDSVAAELVPARGAAIRAGQLEWAGQADDSAQALVEWAVPDKQGNTLSLLLRDVETSVNVREALAFANWPDGGPPTLELLPQEYGIGFLVAQRIIRRIGYVGLHAMSRHAIAQGRDVIDPADILSAAGLADDQSTWGDAIAELVGPDEARLMAINDARNLLGDLYVQAQQRRKGASREGPWDDLCPTLHRAFTPYAICLWDLPAVRGLFPEDLRR